MNGSFYGDYKFLTISPSATLVTSKRRPLFKSVHVYYDFFNAFNAERLASESILYQIISNWLHRN